jgi:REP element-mobilizing transposase RayT
VDSLRRRAVYENVASALGRHRDEDFRVVHFSVQSDHVHLIAEASSKRALSSGMRGVAIRVARAVNRALGRRGSVWSDRYHARPLPTPRTVRNALIYVLANARKHLRAIAGIDPCSSAPWFDGYRDRHVRPASCPLVRPPRTWLLRVGWRRGGGLLSVDDAPRLRDIRLTRHARVRE